MKREDVERLLAQADKFGAIAAAGFRSSVPVDPSELRALCKRWLAVEGARVVEIGADCGRYTVGHYDYDDGPDPTFAGQRVRIVPEGGGDGG